MLSIRHCTVSTPVCTRLTRQRGYLTHGSTSERFYCPVLNVTFITDVFKSLLIQTCLTLDFKYMFLLTSNVNYLLHQTASSSPWLQSVSVHYLGRVCLFAPYDVFALTTDEHCYLIKLLVRGRVRLQQHTSTGRTFSSSLFTFICSLFNDDFPVTQDYKASNKGVTCEWWIAEDEAVHVSLVRILMAVFDISHELEGYLLF
jgi:hypothetical protein